MQKIEQFLTAALVVLALLLGVGVGSANAWPWSSTVTLAGSLVQCTSDGAQSAHVNAVLNDERHEYNTLLGQPPDYSVTFTNVPGGSGGWAWIVVDCAVSGGSQGHWVKVTRPVFGSTITSNL
jgi:hypothetical protein